MLGAVTGGNRYFTLSPSRVRELGIPQLDLLRISPPGSSHLRGLALTRSAMNRLAQEGQPIWLLYPSARPAAATLRYIEEGHRTGADQAYKCRVRKPWWRVPVLTAPDLFLTYMNADTARLTKNTVGARHLNSVHGVYLTEEHRELARDVLPIASLDSMTVLSAELVGRSYGGGILKIEPREADRWWMPAPALITQHRDALAALKPRVQRLLQNRNLLAAVELVDAALLQNVVGETVSSVLPGAASAAFLVTTSAVGLGVIDPRLSLAALLAVPLQVLAVRLYLKRSQPLYRASREAAGARSQLTMEALDGHATLTAFGRGPRAEERIDAAALCEKSLVLEATGVGAQFWGRLNVAEFVGLGAVLAMGWLLMWSESGSVGGLTAAALLFMQLFGPIGIVLSSFDELQRAGASFARLVGILDEPAASSRPSSPTTDVAVMVEGVAYAYGEREVLTDIAFAVLRGGHLAIVGASGAGKSTIASLVNGELTPSRGSIRFGSADSRIALVSQENHLFAGSIRADLTIAKPDASDTQLWAALHAVGASWVSELSDGLDADIEAVETETRRQQLALARVELFAPDVLILDEAASEAGASLRGELSDAAVALASRYTRITIAHRLDQAAAADQVIVLDAGYIVEAGTNAELLAANGAYRRLWDTWHRRD